MTEHDAAIDELARQLSELEKKYNRLKPALNIIEDVSASIPEEIATAIDNLPKSLRNALDDIVRCAIEDAIATPDQTGASNRK